MCHCRQVIERLRPQLRIGLREVLLIALKPELQHVHQDSLSL